MPRVSTTRGYKGRGRFVLRPLAGGRPFEIGNVTEVNETIEVERTSRQNYQDAAGGELDVSETVSSYTLEMTVDDITPENMAIAFAGLANQITPAAVTGEALNVWLGVVAAFAYLPDPAVDPSVVIAATESRSDSTAYAVGDTVLEGGRAYLAVVAGTSDASPPVFPDNLGTVTDGTVTWKDLGEPALVKDTDYTVTPHGIQMLAATAARFYEELPIPLTVGYTSNPQYLIEALTASAAEFEVIWQGLNSVDGGNPMTGRYFRTKFSPTSGFNRSGGDDFASLALSATVLSDETRVGDGLSKFVQLAMI